MSVQLALDHPILLLKPRVQEVSKNFLSTFGFSYFQYLRCYVNGSMGLLTNDTGLFECINQFDNSPVVFSSFENEQINAHSYWFFWDEKLPKMPVEMAREKFNIHHGLTLVRRSKNYYDMIAVGLPRAIENPGSFYLNKLKAIEWFVNDFDVANRDLLELMDENALPLPEPYRDINYQEMCLQKGRVNIAGKHGETYITAQELACLRLLFQGASHKKIAQTMEISVRTVETYLQRIKQRTGFSTTKIELLYPLA